MIPRVGGVGGRRILEIGCGCGGFSNWLATIHPQPLEIVAADFSRTAVELGSKAENLSGRRAVTWEVQDIQSIQRPDEYFDLVISCETIEHVPKPALAIRELSRVLKPGGNLLLTHPNYLSVVGLYRVYSILRGRGFTEEGQPINHPLRTGQVRKWLRNAGLIPSLVASRGHYWLWPGRPMVEVPALCRLGVLTRPFGFHPIWLARKPSR